MRLPRTPAFRLAPLAALLVCASVAPAAVTIQIVADNDFAVYAGTGTTITRSIYQNDVVWNQQLTAAQSFSFELETGETTFYLLAMGGGGEENISGKINGVNIVRIYQDDSSSVGQSSAIQHLLAGYDSSTVASGTYTPALSDVQAALPGVSWGAPSVVTSATVINNNPHSQIEGQPYGFSVPSNQAVFFRFNAESVDVPVVPEPGAVALLGSAALSMGLRRRRVG